MQGYRRRVETAEMKIQPRNRRSTKTNMAEKLPKNIGRRRVSRYLDSTSPRRISRSARIFPSIPPPLISVSSISYHVSLAIFSPAARVNLSTYRADDPVDLPKHLALPNSTLRYIKHYIIPISQSLIPASPIIFQRSGVPGRKEIVVSAVSIFDPRNVTPGRRLAGNVYSGI